MASRKHLVAVNRMVKLLPDHKVAVMGAFVELARDLARSMDAKSGAVVPSLASAYRGVLKDLEHAVSDAAADVKRGSSGGRGGPDAGSDSEFLSDESESEAAAGSGAVEDIDEWRRSRSAS